MIQRVLNMGRGLSSLPIYYIAQRAMWICVHLNNGQEFWHLQSGQDFTPS
jgi:hypothetical protein